MAFTDFKHPVYKYGSFSNTNRWKKQLVRRGYLSPIFHNKSYGDKIVVSYQDPDIKNNGKLVRNYAIAKVLKTKLYVLVDMIETYHEAHYIANPENDPWL